MSLKDWVVHLLSSSPLETFQVYSDGFSLDSPISNELWSQLILTHGKRLLRISVHRMLISWEAIHSICVQCTKLEELFLHVDPDLLVRRLIYKNLVILKKNHAQNKLGSCLSFAKALRTIHINYPMGAAGNSSPVLPQTEALSILNQCSPTVTQVGCNTRVWEVSFSLGKCS